MEEDRRKSRKTKTDTDIERNRPEIQLLTFDDCDEIRPTSLGKLKEALGKVRCMFPNKISVNSIDFYNLNPLQQKQLILYNIYLKYILLKTLRSFDSFSRPTNLNKLIPKDPKEPNGNETNSNKKIDNAILHCKERFNNVKKEIEKIQPKSKEKEVQELYLIQNDRFGDLFMNFIITGELPGPFEKDFSALFEYKYSAGNSILRNECIIKIKLQTGEEEKNLSNITEVHSTVSGETILSPFNPDFNLETPIFLDNGSIQRALNEYEYEYMNIPRVVEPRALHQPHAISEESQESEFDPLNELQNKNTKSYHIVIITPVTEKHSDKLTGTQMLKLVIKGINEKKRYRCYQNTNGALYQIEFARKEGIILKAEIPETQIKTTEGDPVIILKEALKLEQILTYSEQVVIYSKGYKNADGLKFIKNSRYFRNQINGSSGESKESEDEEFGVSGHLESEPPRLEERTSKKGSDCDGSSLQNRQPSTSSSKSRLFPISEEGSKNESLPKEKPDSFSHPSYNSE